MRPNPVRVLFWGLRALAVLGLFFEFMVAGTVLNQVSAIFALTLIMSFVAERNLMARLQLYVGAPPGTDAGSTPPGASEDSAVLRFKLGAMRVVGGMMLVGCALTIVALLVKFEDARRDLGGTRGVIGVMVLASVVGGFGAFAALGRMAPFMRSLQRMGDAYRQRR